MSNLKVTRAIVLKSYKFGESSEILSVFSEEFGRIKVVAKGKRRPRSALAAPLEPFTLSEIIVYFRPEREVHTVKEARMVETFDGFRSSYERAVRGYEILKLLHVALPEHSPHKKVFEMTLKAFRILSKHNSDGVLYAYKVKFLSFMGHRINIHRCAVCRRPLSEFAHDEIFFSPSDFGPLCKNCYLRGEKREIVSIGAENIEEIDMLMRGYFDNLVDFQVSAKVMEIIDKSLMEVFEIPLTGKRIGA